MSRAPRPALLPWPEHASMFVRFFAGFEHALTNSGFAKKQKNVAEADWTAFANVLGASFFEQTLITGIAPTLIAEPPRQMMQGGFWMPKIVDPITGVAGLFVRGVCRVRNNLVHGKKTFVGEAGGVARAHALVLEASNVLEAALNAHPELKKYFGIDDDEPDS